jgi:hypothetical protein
MASTGKRVFFSSGAPLAVAAQMRATAGDGTVVN